MHVLNILAIRIFIVFFRGNPVDHSNPSTNELGQCCKQNVRMIFFSPLIYGLKPKPHVDEYYTCMDIFDTKTMDVTSILLVFLLHKMIVCKIQGHKITRKLKNQFSIKTKY